LKESKNFIKSVEKKKASDYLNTYRFLHYRSSGSIPMEF